MAVTGKTALDTSFVLRLLTGAPSKQFSLARQKVDEVLDQRKALIVSDLVIAETYFALQYHFEVPKKEALEQIRAFLLSGLVEPLSGSVCFDVIQNVDSYKAGFVDQLICGQFLSSCEEILSFDQALAVLPKVTILK